MRSRSRTQRNGRLGMPTIVQRGGRMFLAVLICNEDPSIEHLGQGFVSLFLASSVVSKLELQSHALRTCKCDASQRLRQRRRGPIPLKESARGLWASRQRQVPKQPTKVARSLLATSALRLAHGYATRQDSKRRRSSKHVVTVTSLLSCEVSVPLLLEFVQVPPARFEFRIPTRGMDRLPWCLLLAALKFHLLVQSTLTCSASTPF